MKLRLSQLLVATVIIAVLASCGSDDDAGGPDAKEFYMKFKANGVQMVFDEQAVAVFHYDNNNKSYHCQTFANKTSEINKDALDLMIVDTEELTTGVMYSLKNEVELQVFGPTLQAKAVYWDAAGIGFSAQLPATTDELEVTFTENTGDYVKGTFKGRVFTSVDRDEVVFTEGEFKLSKH
jgi:hypothetical protein